jgi:hypothetical protein
VQGGIGLKSSSLTKVSASWLFNVAYVTAPIVSMVDGELFDKLERIGAIIKHKESEPFGGIQAMCRNILADL